LCISNSLFCDYNPTKYFINNNHGMTKMSTSEIKSRSNNHHLALQSSNVLFNPGIGLLKATSVLLASIALVACGGSGGGGSASATAASTNTNASFDGVWRACEADGADSDQFVIDLKSGTLSFQVTSHVGNTTCSNARFSTKTGVNIIDFTLGSTVAVNGTVSGITTATKVDFVEGALLPDDEPTFAPFQLVAIQDNVLFLGDADGANDGMTEPLRPTQLDPLGSTKQVALTSVDGVWRSCEQSDSGSGSEQTTLALTVGFGTLVTKPYTSNNCSTGESQDTSVGFTYTLGSQVTVNASVEGNTNATQFTTTLTEQSGDDPEGTMDFSLITINGTKLFIGDTDFPSGGASETFRAEQLQDLTFNKI
jgi:hypothetical protein